MTYPMHNDPNLPYAPPAPNQPLSPFVPPQGEYHELKYEEIRYREDGINRGKLVYYCVCGGYRGEVAHLNKAAMMTKFFEEHLS